MSRREHGGDGPAARLVLLAVLAVAVGCSGAARAPGSDAAGGAAGARSGAAPAVAVQVPARAGSPGLGRGAPLAGEALADRLHGHMEFLASDALGGRETGTVHGAVTARYVASVFRSLGLEPAGDDGSFLQGYELVAAQLDPEACSLALRSAERDGAAAGEPADTAPDLAIGRDWVVRGFGGDGFDLSAGAVFVGHGIAGRGRDDYEGLELEGRFAIALAGQPDDVDGSVSWRSRRRAAEQRGAAGMLLVLGDDENDDRAFDLIARDLERRTMSLPGSSGETGFPFVLVRSAAAARLLGPAGLDVAAERERGRSGGCERRALPGLLVELAAPVRSTQVRAENAIARIAGTDPALAAEHVVVSAHMDHIGIDAEGGVNNGADDNASGTTALLTLAEILSAAPPRRSVLLLSVSAEEKGLLGSEWWAGHPTVPLESLVANVNIDMVGRNEPDTIGVTPSPAHDDHNVLVTRAVALAPAFGLAAVWEVGSPERRRPIDSYYERSDHVHFARLGIPVVFFFSGEHADYHQPTDTLDKIDFDKLARVVGLVARLVREVADDPERPPRLAPRPEQAEDTEPAGRSTSDARRSAGARPGGGLPDGAGLRDEAGLLDGGGSRSAARLPPAAVAGSGPPAGEAVPPDRTIGAALPGHGRGSPRAGLVSGTGPANMADSAGVDCDL